MTSDLVPGEVRTGDEPVTINEGRETATVRVANTGDRPVQIGSHLHFVEANAALRFDRETAVGMRLNVPAGTAVRFEPGETEIVELVAIGGERRVTGINGLANGPVDDAATILDRARNGGFLDESDAADGGSDATDGGEIQ